MSRQFKQLIILLLAILAMITAPVCALGENAARKIAVISFGLSGEQSVFRSEATGAASVVAKRFVVILLLCASIPGKAVTQRLKV